MNLSFLSVSLILWFLVPQTLCTAHPDEPEHPGEVIFTRRASPRVQKKVQEAWAAGASITFRDSQQKILPFKPNDIRQGSLLALGRFCVTGEGFPPKHYDPLAQPGFLGDEGICGPFKNGTGEVIHMPYAAYIDPKGKTRFTYRELFLDEKGMLWFGYKIFSLLTVMLTPLDRHHPESHQKIIHDFIESRGMNQHDFCHGLKSTLTTKRFSATLAQYPWMADWCHYTRDFEEL